MKNNWTSLAIGLAAGTFGGMLGIGGGILMIPLLTGLLKLAQRQAHGTSLVALVFTGLSGAAAYAVQGNVAYWAAAALALAAMATARRGARFAHALPEATLRRWFGVFLLVFAALLMAKPWLPSAGQHPLWVKMILLLFTGVVTGFLSGMMGVGGGVVMIPAMVLLAGFDQHTAQGTSLLVMVPVGIAGAWTHHKMGNVVKGCLPGLIPGILLGAFLGSLAANRVEEAPLRFVFIAGMIYMGIRYIRAQAPVEGD